MSFVIPIVYWFMHQHFVNELRHDLRSTMEYLGEAGGFIGTTIFLSEFCHFRVPKFFYVIEGIVFGGSVVLVHTAEHNHIFYKSISMDYSGDFPRLVLDYGVGFITFYIFLAEKLNAVYSENVKKAAEGLTSSLSIGIVLSSSIGGTENSEAFETLYGLADKALYQTKENGRNGYSFYEKVTV